MPADLIAPRTSAALTQAAAVGPYFAVQLGLDDGPWRHFEELVTAEVLRENVVSVQTVLADRTGIAIPELDLRACASTHFLGLASRLLAPALATVALAGQDLVVDPRGLRWQRVAGGPVPIALLSADGNAAPNAAAVRLPVVGSVIAALVDAFAETFALSRQVLWGNVASALNGAATMLLRSGAPLALDPLAVVAAVLGTGPLVGTAAYTDAGFVRSNCCLFYKIPGGGMCGDCVLISAETRRGI